jgi:sulfide:quinone oxidoreductase
MTSENSHSEKLRVIVAGGGVAALETVLALADLAPEQTDVTVISPNDEFVYRPMTVREPFAYGAAKRYPLAAIVREAGAELLSDELAWVDPVKQTIHTKADEAIAYDALVLALGAKAHTRYQHALTIDDRRMDETLHGLIQDIEGGYLHSLAFVSPGRMPWQLPLYELALMTAGRAYDVGLELAVTIVTPEDAPLAIFGASASRAVSEVLEKAHITTITSAYAEVPSAKQVVINPGDRHLQVDRVIALPELYGPSVRGIPLAEHGFIRVNRFGQVLDAGPIYAAGDALEFPV